MLHELLKIKRIRENAAETEVLKCQNRVDAAEQQLQQKQQELEEYIDWRSKEEKRLYDNIINMEIRQNDLDNLKKKVAMLREKDATLQQEIAEAEKKLSEEQQALEQAQEEHTKAMQAVQKFEEFTKVQDAEARKEAERLEDLEMEEFTTRPKF